MATTAASKSTRSRSTKAVADTAPAEAKQAFEVIQGLPKRSYNAKNRVLKHTAFAAAVIAAQEGVPAETPVADRPYIEFTSTGKGVAGNIQGGQYAAFRSDAGRFVAKTRTDSEGVTHVFVTFVPNEA